MSGHIIYSLNTFRETYVKIKMHYKGPFTPSTSVNAATTVFIENNGVTWKWVATSLFSMRTESLASSQRCRRMDADAWCKWTPKESWGSLWTNPKQLLSTCFLRIKPTQENPFLSFIMDVFSHLNTDSSQRIWFASIFVQNDTPWFALASLPHNTWDIPSCLVGLHLSPLHARCENSVHENTLDEPVHCRFHTPWA